jgi:benzodiazapine receptor
MNRSLLFKLIASIFVCQLIGWLGAIFTTPNIENWYSTLTKPLLTPPNWVFGPVWTILFLLMGISLFLVWQKGHNQKTKLPLAIFIGQLILNLAWSLVFFGQNSPGGGLIIIIALWSAILLNIITFYRVQKLAAYLLFPYLLWVSFALYLNYGIWLFN